MNLNKRGIYMKLNSLTTATSIAATTPATKATAKAPAKTKATPATTAISKPAAKTPVAVANKEEKKYDAKKVMKMVEKMLLTLTKFENAINDLWMNKHILTMEQSDLFSVFYAKEFLNKCMKKDQEGVEFLYPNFVEEVESIGDNFDLIEDYLDKDLIEELLEFANLAQEL